MSFEIWEMSFLYLFFIYVNEVQTELAFLDLLLPTSNYLAIIFPIVTALVMFPTSGYYLITIFVIVLAGIMASMFFKNRVTTAVILILVSFILIV